MDRRVAIPGIRFNDYIFSEPARLVDWTPSPCAGLLAILAEDGTWAPKPFRTLYFAEFGNNAALADILDECRHVLTAEARVLYISAVALPFSTTAQRLAICTDLIRAYNPAYQFDNHRASRQDLVRKIEELERSNHQRAAQVLPFVPNDKPPATPRRRIGFIG